MLLSPPYRIGPVAYGYRVTIPSGKVSSNLTNFPVLVDLADMPVGFWSYVSRGGTNLRAFAADGVTPLALDVISCLNTTQVGCVAVKVTVTAASATSFIIRAIEGAPRVAPDAPYGRNAVWSDYKAVLAGGQSFQNRTGKSLSRVWGYPQGFEVVSTSGIISGHEGVVGDGSTFVVIGSNALRKYNSTFSAVIQSNLNPAGASGGTDCGGGCYYDGKLYVTTGAPQKISVFDYATLAFITAFDINAQAAGAGGLEYCPEDGLIYTIVYDATAPFPLQMHRFSPVDGSYQGAVTLTTQSGVGLPNVQGLIWHKDAFYAPVDTVSRYYRIARTGEVTEGGEFGGGAVEDGFSDGDSIYNFVRTAVDNGYVQRWRPFVDEFGGGMRLTANGRVNIPITPSTTWTMRATGRRSDATTRVIAALAQPGSAFGNAVNMAWVTSSLRPAFDVANGALAFTSPPAPSTSTDFMMHIAYDGTAARHGWYNGGSKITEPAIRARGADLTFLICGNERETIDSVPWRGRIGLCYVRDGVLSDAWIAAEFANFNDPAFYSISAA